MKRKGDNSERLKAGYARRCGRIYSPPMSLGRPFLLRLDVALLRAIDARAAAAGQTRTGLIRQCLSGTFRAPDRVSAAIPPVISSEARSASNASPPSRRQIHIRISGGEFEAATRRAGGWRSVAAWAAAVVRRELGQGGPLVSDADRLTVAASTRELRRLGVNLNQVAHRLNAEDRHQVTPLERTDIMRALHVIDLHVDFVERVYAQAAPERAEVDHRRR